MARPPTPISSRQRLQALQILSRYPDAQYVTRPGRGRRREINYDLAVKLYDILRCWPNVARMMPGKFAAWAIYNAVRETDLGQRKRA